MTDPVHEGGCLCGAVRYRARGTPLTVVHCHCLQCRGSSGAPFMTWATFPEENVVFSGTRSKIFASSDTAHRRFCPRCGTQIVWIATPSRGTIDIAVASLDDPNRLSPTCHLFVKRRIAWLHIDDALPCHAAWKDPDREA